MSLYSNFAGYYERIFPIREDIFHFLMSCTGKPGNQLLDIGCGPGHYCGRFAREGFRATGIDLDETMIAEAKKHYPDASFRCLEMRRAAEAGSTFDCIWSIGNVMAHLPQKELTTFITNIHELLNPGGIWIIQVMHWEPLMALPEYHFPVRSIEAEGAKATFHRRYTSITPSTLQFTVSLRNETSLLFEEAVTLYPVTLDNYLAAHKAAEFESEGIWSDFSGAPLKNEPGTGLVLVFRKGSGLVF